MTVNQIAQETGLAYQTTYRYLQYMLQEKMVTAEYVYGKVGRPKQLFCLASKEKRYAQIMKFRRAYLSDSVNAKLTHLCTVADRSFGGFLRGKGLDKFFTHSLGHGVGINIHEKPVLGPSGKDVLRDGMVFSVEPGVYFEGHYGIRIEDTAALSGGKAQSFMKTEKRLTVL